MNKEEFYNRVEELEKEYEDIYSLTDESTTDRHGVVLIWTENDEVINNFNHEDIEIIRKFTVGSDGYIHPHVRGKDVHGWTRCDLKLK